MASFRSQSVSLLPLDLCTAGKPVCPPFLSLAASCSFSITLLPRCQPTTSMNEDGLKCGRDCVCLPSIFLPFLQGLLYWLDSWLPQQIWLPGSPPARFSHIAELLISRPQHTNRKALGKCPKKEGFIVFHFSSFLQVGMQTDAETCIFLFEARVEVTC